MLLHTSTYEGLPPRLYRRPSEIQADIAEVRAKAEEIENMLSVREMLLCSMGDDAEKNPEVWIPEVEAALDEAREALERLHLLRDTLKELGEELGDVKCLYRA